MRHLTAADYTVMPWANGRGVTTELIRVDRDGALDWRLSIAQVVEDGPFSRLPGIARNLTVIEGPGFDLLGPGVRLRAEPLVPVAFLGDWQIRAAGVVGPSVDFNVMTAGRPARVRVVRAPEELQPAGATLCVFALAAAGVTAAGSGSGGRAPVQMARHDLLITSAPVVVQGLVLAVWIV